MVEISLKSQITTNITRNIDIKTPKLTVYIKTNEINPLNMGEYHFTDTDEQVVDHVILFASNIHGTISTVKLYHNYNQAYILNNANTLIKPLQDKGIKVLLGLLGDYTGVGFANLTYDQRNSFALQVAACVTTYGLDGVDFDEEFANYGSISGTPAPSGDNFSLLIQRLRELMPDKLITLNIMVMAPILIKQPKMPLIIFGQILVPDTMLLSDCPTVSGQVCRYIILMVIPVRDKFKVL